jgi:hypothetical protein
MFSVEVGCVWFMGVVELRSAVSELGGTCFDRRVNSALWVQASVEVFAAALISPLVVLPRQVEASVSVAVWSAPQPPTPHRI